MKRHPLLRITAPHFCAGIIPGIRSAPILSYMRSWPLILHYCEEKGWQVDRVKPTSR